MNVKDEGAFEAEEIRKQVAAIDSLSPLQFEAIEEALRSFNSSPPPLRKLPRLLYAFEAIVDDIEEEIEPDTLLELLAWQLPADWVPGAEDVEASWKPETLSAMTRLRVIHGHWLRDLMAGAGASSLEWTSLVLRPVAVIWRDGSRTVRLHMEILRKDYAQLIIETRPSSLLGLISVLLNSAADLPKEALEGFTPRSVDRLNRAHSALLEALEREDIRSSSND